MLSKLATDEAIAILEARPDIHIVFTDIQMPGSMDGLKLARFVRGRWPPIKIVARDIIGTSKVIYRRGRVSVEAIYVQQDCKHSETARSLMRAAVIDVAELLRSRYARASGKFLWEQRTKCGVFT